MRFQSRLLLAFSLLVAAPATAQNGDARWFYRDSDITPDPAWTFGTLPNGLRYAVRRNALPAGQVSIRLRVDAGALNEEDHQQGWAHFIEHMAFRGTASFKDGEARETWQKLGASFGSDTNASTSATQTVYQLDLPHADKASLDTSLRLLAEMADTARFDPAIVEAERKVVLAEKGRRPELNVRLNEISKPLFYAGLKFADRDIIGTDATLGGATADGLRAFYERWYRPERTTIVMVGDADPKLMEELIVARFGSWQGSGPAPADPDYGAIADPQQSTAALAYPGAPAVASAVWLRPYADEANTVAREREDLADTLAVRIINRRLEARARGAEAPFIAASLGTGTTRNVADMTQLQVTARDGKWRDGVVAAFATLADATAAPPSKAEIDRELQNVRLSTTAAVQGDATVRSNARADQLVSAMDTDNVVATAAYIHDLMERLGTEMSPELVHRAMKGMFEGAGPRMALLTPTAVEGGAAAVAEALSAARAAAPAARLADRSVSMDALPALGSPGQEVSRERIEDMDVTIVRFANGSSLTFKQTDFEKGSVAVQLRFGSGMAGLPADQPSLSWLSGLVAPSGLADLDLDGLERLLTGRRIGLNFSLGQDALVLASTTNGTDLADQLRLFATKLAYPRWDDALFARYQASFRDSNELSFASASARASRELPSLLMGGDKRWEPLETATIGQATPQGFKDLFGPMLASGPVQAIVVGDVDLETAVNAMKGTIAALPARPAAPTPNTDVRPPTPSPAPVRFTHRGDKNQAYAAIGWNTFGGLEHRRERRALAVAANMLQVRLFERLRQVEGASYSPGASSSSSDRFKDWGVFYAASELRPESVDTFYRIAREIVADLAARPASAAEFERAINPVVSGIERRVRTNAYWLGALEDWTAEPVYVEATRTYLSDYQRLTAEDVRAAVATYVADGGDWSMVVLPEQP